MKVIEQSAIGGPDVLALIDAPTPEPGVGEVRIDVSAAGVNPVDAAVRAGAFPLLGEPPFRVGWDAAGRVAAVGPKVDGFRPGDRVMGLLRFPAQAAAYADTVIASAAEIVSVPTAVSDTQAGALPLVGLTAWQGLVEHGNLAAGEKVLVHAGAGGVGHLAIQIAKAKGAEVWTTASAGKADTVRRLGADHVIDYQTEDFTRAGPFDLILDHAGGDHALRSLSALAPGGRLVSLLDLAPDTERRAKTEGKTAVRMSVHPDAAGLGELARLAEAGQLTVLVARTFPLTEAGAAQAALDDRPAGKIVLVP